MAEEIPSKKQIPPVDDVDAIDDYEELAAASDTGRNNNSKPSGISVAVRKAMTRMSCSSRKHVDKADKSSGKSSGKPSGKPPTGKSPTGTGTHGKSGAGKAGGSKSGGGFLGAVRAKFNSISLKTTSTLAPNPTPASVAVADNNNNSSGSSSKSLAKLSDFPGAFKTAVKKSYSKWSPTKTFGKPSSVSKAISVGVPPKPKRKPCAKPLRPIVANRSFSFSSFDFNNSSSFMDSKSLDVPLIEKYDDFRTEFKKTKFPSVRSLVSKFENLDFGSVQHIPNLFGVQVMGFPSTSKISLKSDDSDGSKSTDADDTRRPLKAEEIRMAPIAEEEDFHSFDEEEQESEPDEKQEGEGQGEAEVAVEVEDKEADDKGEFEFKKIRAQFEQKFQKKA